MHEAAVIGLCVLVGYYLWLDVVEAYVAWYSAAEPPLPRRTRLGIGLRVAVGTGAIATALATLQAWPVAE